jgi:hypothetical protein
MTVPSLRSIGSFFRAAERRLQNWNNPRPVPSDAEDIKRIAQGLGLSVSELSEILAPGSERSDLLRRRMALLALDPDEMATSEPAMFRELQIHCAQCESRKQCMLDFVRTSDQPDWQGWREYCPNGGTLNALRILQICSDRAPQFPYGS